MPRSKPRAQRLAPPSSASHSEPHSHQHTAASAASHANSSQRASQREQPRNPRESFGLNQPRLSTSPISRTPKRRERPASTSSAKVPHNHNHAQTRVRTKTPDKRSISQPSTNSIPGTVVDIDPFCESPSRPSTDACARKPGLPRSGSLSPRVSRPSSPLSCATSDTASVALEDCVPELEEFDDIVLPAMATRRNPEPNKLTTGSSSRNAKGRFSNGSVGKSSKSRSRVSEGSRAKKAVVADPTEGPASSMAPAPALEICNPVRAEKVGKRKNSGFILVPDDEVKSVFDRKRGSTDGLGISAVDVERNTFGEYWKGLETVSIRRSTYARADGKNGGQQCVRQDSNKAPSLDPPNRGSSSKMTKSTGKRRATKHRKPEGNVMDVDKGEDRRPITEENIDGSDAIPVQDMRKRKVMKRARSNAHDAFRRSSTKQKSPPRSLIELDPAVFGLGNRGRDGSMKGTGTEVGLENGLDDGEDTGGSTGFSESDGQACMQCGGHGKASKMVLCDVCSDGCHTFCMRPARASVPLGVWICPKCHTVAKKHKVHLSQLPSFLKSSGRTRE